MTLPAPTAADRASALFEAHSAEVLRFLRRRDPDLAEDALSETFAVAVRRAADIPAGRELPWLYVVAEHVLRNLQRSRRRAARIPEALHPFTRATTEPTEPAFIGDALSDLPDRERILLTMTALEGLSAQEAADRMGIPYGSARNSLSTGRKRLAIVLAAAAILVLVVGIIGEIADRARRQPLEVLASSLSQARIVHDVAVVSHDDGSTGRAGAAASPGAVTPAAARYERWSDGSGDRTRVRLPGGTEVVAQRGETLRAAARQQVPGTAQTPTRRRAVREDLTALDAASPNAIAALLADPMAQRTAADGPTIDGHDTTTVRGRIADAAGVEHDVRVFVADDEPIVLRVRVRSPGAAGTVDAAATQAATVDFTAWKATPRRAAEATAPTSPVADAPAASAGAHAAAPTPDAAGGDPDRSGRSGAADASAGDGRTVAESPGPNTNGSPRALTSPGVVAPTPPATPEPKGKFASAPIVHVRQTVQTCSGSDSGSSYCYSFGDREVWFEQSGKQRSRSRVRRSSGAVRNEEWLTGEVRNYFTVSPDGRRIRGLRERLSDGGPQAKLPIEWRGEWLNALAPEIAALRASPARIAALPAGPDIGGRATRLYVASAQVTDASGMATDFKYTADVAVDPASGVPRRVTFHREFQTSFTKVTLEIAAWEQVPAGEYARLVSRSFPRGATVRDWD